ncbi:MAG: DMT family transporter [Ignavibacteriales bacterium]|nr:DMT family transporter [Ignavibacteriales bacterium]
MTIRTRAELYLLSCTLIWGGTFVVVKGGLDDSSPLLFVAIRFAIATLLFLPFVVRNLGSMTRKTLEGGLVVGFLLFLGFVFQTVGLTYTTASKSGFITGLLVVFTPVFQVLIERRAPKAGNVIGVVLVTAGLYLLTSPEGSEFNVGDLLTLFCAAVFGLYIVYLDIYTKQGDVWQIVFLQFVVTAVGAALWAVFFEEMFLDLTPGLWGALAYLSLLATLYTLTVQTRYQKETTPTRAAVIFSIEPVFAAVIAYVALGERIGLLGVIGGGVVVGGLLVSELSDVFFMKGD